MSLRTLFLCLIVMFTVTACSNTENQDETAAPDNTTAPATSEAAEDAVEEQVDASEVTTDTESVD